MKINVYQLFYNLIDLRHVIFRTGDPVHDLLYSARYKYGYQFKVACFYDIHFFSQHQGTLNQ